jgi:membrane protease YdiL (CAAX protease family)
MTKSTNLVIDIMVVAAVSGLAFFLEDIAVAQGWLPLGEGARGVSAVLGGAFAAVGVVLARGGSLADLGFKQPERWAIVFYQAAAVLVAFVAVQTLVPLLISLFMTVPEPDMSKYGDMSGDLRAAITMALILVLTASIPEEIIYRGFLIGRLSDIFGQTPRGAIMTVGVQSLIFGSIHYQWGIGGVIMTLLMGLVWGTAYLMCGRNIWVVIFAHSGGHVLLVTQLYFAQL